MPEHPMEHDDPDVRAAGEGRPNDPSADTEAGDAAAALERERDALQDRLLRTAAEFDNYRRRVERERRELSQFAAADVLTEVLPIVDDLERALGAAGTTDTTAYRQGVELVHRKMLDLLRRRGVKPIDALGSDFDPNLHEAVAHEPSDRHREGEVMEEMRRGYLLGERLLRPAMVKVAKVS